MFPDEMTVDLDTWNTVYGRPAQQMRTLYFAAVVSNFLLFSYTRLAGNAGLKKSPKVRHLRTIAQLCRGYFRN